MNHRKSRSNRGRANRNTPYAASPSKPYLTVYFTIRCPKLAGGIVMIDSMLLISTLPQCLAMPAAWPIPTTPTTRIGSERPSTGLICGRAASCSEWHSCDTLAVVSRESFSPWVVVVDVSDCDMLTLTSGARGVLAVSTSPSSSEELTNDNVTLLIVSDSSPAALRSRLSVLAVLFSAVVSPIVSPVWSRLLLRKLSNQSRRKTLATFRWILQTVKVRLTLAI
uniref:Uncharacterized protein n=1 Tax=Anopheles coluzzii TaxID=1518534 RepID=A0A8W7Q1E0_ANOCL